MNILKSLLLPISLALLTTWGINYFFGNKDKQISTDGQTVSGQSFVAPEKGVFTQPLYKEIDFLDNEQVKDAEEVVVDTDLYTARFSTHGAGLESFVCKKNKGILAVDVSTLIPAGAHKKEETAFLIALKEKTPFYYTFEGKREEGNLTFVTYKAVTNQAVIVKTYILDKISYKIELEVTVESKHGEVLQPRLIFPAPILGGDEKIGKESLMGVVAEKKDAIVKTAQDKINPLQGWYSPTLFGAENRFFINVLVGDADHFVKRAYYRLDEENIFAMLEGQEVQTSTTWKLSFYCGPKIYDAMVAIDQRLQNVLDYAGWFAPISRFMLWMLKWLYTYFNNYGLAIIALTVLIRLILLPFTMNNDDNLKKRAEFDKKLKYLQQKYRDDKVRLAEERAELIKKHGVPGMGGCLPLLLQIPVFFALARLLGSTIELYKAPFWGWITDLSIPDRFYVLPVLVAVSLFVQAFFVDEKQRFTMLISGLVFGAFAVNLASGLVLYFFVSTILGLLQTVLVRRFKEAFGV